MPPAPDFYDFRFRLREIAASGLCGSGYAVLVL